MKRNILTLIILALIVVVVVVLAKRGREANPGAMAVYDQSISDGRITLSFPSATYGLAAKPEPLIIKSYIPACAEGFDYCIFEKGLRYQGTNFESAGLTVMKRPDLMAERLCLETPPAGYSAGVQPNATTSTDLYALSKFARVGDAAAGHYASGSLYRLYDRGSAFCYEFLIRVGQTQFSNYPAGTIKEFTDADQAKIEGELNAILATLTLGGQEKIDWGDLLNVSTSPASAVPETISVNGVFQCLPHKDRTGPQTMECAYGLKDGEGKYYALDFSGMPTSAFDLPMNQPYVVTGLFTPRSAAGQARWLIYDVAGQIKVSKYEEVRKDIPVKPINSVQTLELKKPIIVADVKLRVEAVFEDSRCPINVQCIQAGRVLIGLSAETATSTATYQMKVGDTVKAGSVSVTLSKVTPQPRAGAKIADADYRFEFSLKLRD